MQSLTMYVYVMYGVFLLINPRRACATRVTVVVSCVCVSVCMYVCPYMLFWQYARLKV